MDIHKPKAWHGWREFAKEYGIIVLGVLTALAGEQLVEWAHWRQVAGEAREAIATDHRRTLAAIGVTDAAGACVQRRADDLRAILDTAERTGRLPPLPRFATPPNLSWALRGWEGVVNGQALPHLHRGETEIDAAIANYIGSMIADRDRSRADWSVVATMAGPGRPFSSAEAANLRAALGRAVAADSDLRGKAGNVAGMILAAGLLTPGEAKAAWQKGVDNFARRNAICTPLGRELPIPSGRQLGSPATPPTVASYDYATR